MSLSVEMFPARFGDALWLEYGDPERPYRILIDGGKIQTADLLAQRIRAVAEREGRCRFELVVLTHIDGDHIEGLLKLMDGVRKGDVDVEIGEVWFNGAPQLPGPDDDPAPPGATVPLAYGGVQGEMLAAVIEGIDPTLWTSWAQGGPIFVPDDGPLPERTLPGGLRVTVLGPPLERLRKLRRTWEREIDKWSAKQGIEELTAEALLDALAHRPEGRPLVFGAEAGLDVEELLDAKFKRDGSRPNGGSLALLVELDGASCLLGGDAYSTDMGAAVDRLMTQRGLERLPVDAFKLPHHGSRASLDEGLLDKLDCDVFLVSTDSSVFGHPDAEALARVVAGGPRRDPAFRAAHPARLVFNYDAPETRLWDGVDVDGRPLTETWGFATHYPERGKEGATVVLGPEVMVRDPDDR